MGGGIETVKKGKKGDRGDEIKSEWWGSVLKKILPVNAGDMGFIPDPGRSHIVQSN